MFWEVGEELLLEAVRDRSGCQLSHEPEQVRRNTDMMGLAANRFLLSSDRSRQERPDVDPPAGQDFSQPACCPAGRA